MIMRFEFVSRRFSLGVLTSTCTQFGFLVRRFELGRGLSEVEEGYCLAGKVLTVYSYHLNELLYCSMSHADADVDSFKRFLYTVLQSTIPTEYEVSKLAREFERLRCDQQFSRDIIVLLNDNGTLQSKQNFQSSSTTFITFQGLCLRQELLEYMSVHENDASASSQPSWGKTCTLELYAQLLGEGKQFYLVWLVSSSTSLILIYCSTAISFSWEATSQFQNLLKIRILVWGKLIQKFAKKEYAKKAFKDMFYGLGKLIQLMHVTMVPKQVKT
ncbi:hypothetical protein Tco_0188842 [Tanacetum coccineum]